MAELIYNDDPGAVPANYRFPPGLDARLYSVSAMFDGSGAGGAFLPCLSVYSQDDKLVGRFFPEEVAAGDSAEVTFAPFLGAARASPAASGQAFATVVFASGASAFVQTSGVAAEPLDYGTGASATLNTNDASIFSLSARGRLQIANNRTYIAWAVATSNGNITRFIQLKQFTYNGAALVGSTIPAGIGAFLSRTSFVPNTDTSNLDLSSDPVTIQAVPADPSYTVELSPFVTINAVGRSVINWYLYALDVGAAPLAVSNFNY